MSKADPVLAAYGASIMLKHLQAMLREITGVRAADDSEYLHRMRVASRRLRVALGLFGTAVSRRRSPGWQKDLRRLTRSLGAARDLDVQILQVQAALAAGPPMEERPGLRRLILRLRQRRARHQKAVVRALDWLLENGTLASMEEKITHRVQKLSPQGEDPSPALFTLAQDAVEKRLDRFLSYAVFVPMPERKDELHAMRIAAKHLRYTMEVFAPLYSGGFKAYLQAARRAQELLGQIHDGDVWIDYLPDFCEMEARRTRRYFGHERPFQRLEVGLLAFAQERAAERRTRYEEFNASWEEWQQNGFWQSLPDHLRTQRVEIHGTDSSLA